VVKLQHLLLLKSARRNLWNPRKSTILSLQVMALLTPEAQASIKIHKDTYQWTDPQTDKTVKGSRSLLNKALKLMHPDIQANVYMKNLPNKSIKPVNYAFNMIKWHLAIESKCVLIEQKLPGSYHKSQFIVDYRNASLTVEVQNLISEISIVQSKYLCGNPDKCIASYISSEIIKTYNKMSEDGT
jgi:hypothetical protein